MVLLVGISEIVGQRNIMLGDETDVLGVLS